MSGAAKYINRVLMAKPMLAILLATLVGAFSPFCSCGVIPVIAALLIGGVPLAPVMSFWIVSPSMDPEIFFLSVATIGWNLAIWRLGSTLLLSLAAGFITHFFMKHGWLGEQILKDNRIRKNENPLSFSDRLWLYIKNIRTGLAGIINNIWLSFKDTGTPAANTNPDICCAVPAAATDRQLDVPIRVGGTHTNPIRPLNSSENTANSCDCKTERPSFMRRLVSETGSATMMVAKFMTLAFLLQAIITLYIPPEWISKLLGNQNPFAIFTAALIGVPAYTSNLTALPMINGLLALGMNPGAALAFLIAGPTTTLPAMAAVHGLTNKRVFLLYLSFSLFGALIFGYFYSIVILF